MCRLQAELARLRSQVERGQAQQVELRYRLSVEQRDGQRLSRDRSALAGERSAPSEAAGPEGHPCVCVCVWLPERAAQLQQTVQELQKVLDLTQRGREEDQRAQQQEVEERDALMEELTSENQRLHQLLQVRLSHTHTHTRAHRHTHPCLLSAGPGGGSEAAG